MSYSYKKSISQNSKYDLANARIIKKNLVYLIGIPQEIAKKEILSKNEYLGQYGKIIKLIVNKPQLQGQNKNQYSVYVTYQKENEAMVCRLALEEFKLNKNIIKASFGTTKYCNYFINKQKCLNQECLYLHQKQIQDDIFTQETVQQEIKNLSQQQKIYFTRNVEQFINVLKIIENNVFPSFQYLLDKFQINQNEESEIFQDQWLKNLKNYFDFKDIMDKKIVEQFFNKLNCNHISRYQFAIDNESTENSSVEQDKQMIYQIFDLKNQINKKCSFQFVTGNGKLNKSLKIFNSIQG